MEEWMIFQILANMFSLPVLTAMVIGVLFGLLIGALPGLTATMGVALLIPLTFGMDPAPALVMLMSIYTAAIKGGSISAILLHTPGTPASAATALDGYPLAVQGKAASAICAAALASVVGGVVSGFALLLLAPPLSVWALKFGPPEYFLLACFGMTVIASLASGSMLKGLTAGVFGLLLGSVGVDVMTGFARYHFGLMPLLGGFPLIPVLIGLFALSEVLMMSETARDKTPRPPLVKGWDFLSALRALAKAKMTIIRSAIIGVFVGILPGAGADIGSWVSYNEARRFSRHSEKFGKGAMEGVIASETANNAATGATVIPLLTLGIPGGPAAAVILGGLLIQGLRPGRELFTVHAEMMYTVIAGFIFANILMGIIGLPIVPALTRITRVPVGIVAPLVVALCVVGSFAVANQMYDVWIMIGFGLVGYLMRKFGFPPAATVLGFILGPIAELGLRQSLVLGEGALLAYFFGRPISVVLMALIIISLLSPLFIRKAIRPVD